MAQIESRHRATSDPGARKDVLKQIEDGGIEDVLLWFTDLGGHLKSFSITIGEVEGALDDGMGFDTFNVGPEAEYFLFKDEHGTETLDEGGYFAQTTLDAATGIRRDTIRALESMGIPVEYHHHEVGPSQHENGSGMHTHQSLFTGGRNQFFDESDKWHLSATAKAFIAGQLRHARELSAVFAQWVNSYKRLVPGYEAPVYVAWSQRNRSALIRIPLYKPGSEQATRAEIRCPDPACNPYLTFATLLHAGLDGIEKGYDLPEPMETNLYHLTAEQRHRVQLTQWELDRYLPVL